MNRKLLFVVLTMLTLLLVMGCTHSLRITNNQWMTPSSVKPVNPVKIGFVASNDPLINSVIEETHLNPAIKEVKKAYQFDSSSSADYVLELTHSMNYSASWQNLPITIPGFLIFTHAWLGYKYYVAIDTNSKLMDYKGNIISEQKLTTPYEFRYTSFARGAATSLIGWCSPGYGIIDIVPGILFSTSYDDRANEELNEKLKPHYKEYISSKVIEQIAEHQKKNPSYAMAERGQQENTVSENAVITLQKVALKEEPKALSPPPVGENLPIDKTNSQPEAEEIRQP